MKKILCVIFALAVLSGVLNHVQADDSSRIKYNILSYNTCEVAASQPSSLSGDISIPEIYNNYYTVVGIADGAFKNRQITSVKLPESITYIGASAFSDCGRLTEINLPAGLQKLGDYVFTNTALESIVFPESLTTIGWDMFYGCNKLTTVYYNAINADVDRSIDLSAPPRAKAYASDENWGALFSKFRVKFPVTVEKVVFGPKVESIAAGSFLDCVKITEVRLPESLQSIGVEAFAGCTGLTSLKMGENVRKIKDGAFRGCANITEWELSPALETIGEEAFANCVGLKKVLFPENFESVGPGAFKGCHGIEEIYCNTRKVLTISGWDVTAFEEGLSLKKLEYGPKGFGCFKLLKAVQNVDEVVYNTVSLKVMGSMTEKYDYIIPPVAKKVLVGEGVTQIPYNFMPGNSYVEEVELPSTITYIGESAFQACALTRMELPDDCTEVEDYAFAYCQSLSEVGWNNLVKIGDYAFSGCPIKEMPDFLNFIYVGDGAFQYNPALETLSIPYGFSIPPGCFTGCSNLKTLYYDGVYGLLEVEFKLSRYFPSTLETVVLGPHIQIVSHKMFMDLENLKSVTLNEATLKICDDAFNGCVSLEKIDIPSGVLVLGKRAFKGCSSLQEIVLSDGIKEIPQECFANCSNLALAVLPDNLTTIGESAFSHCGLTEIKFGSCPVEIGKSAFSSIMEENMVKKIEFGNLEAFINSTYYDWEASPVRWDGEAQLFVDSQEVTEVVLPEEMTVICPGKFLGLYNVDVTVPKHVARIGERAFMRSGIKYFESDALAYVGKEAFGNSGLIEFRASGSMTEINYGTFWSMYQLEVLILPDGIRYVDEYGVTSLPKLKKLRVPADIRGTAKFSFTFASESLMEVYYPATNPKELKNCMFSKEAYESGTLYVPAEALESIGKLVPWKFFKNVQAYDFKDESGAQTVPVEAPGEEITAIYNLAGVNMGRSLDELPAGIYFVRKGNSTEKIVKRP